MKNIKNSLTFFLALRRTLSEFLNTSHLNDQAKKLSIDYILSEASDYELLTLALTGNYPIEKYNSLKEVELLKSFKSLIIEDFDNLYKYLGKETLVSVIQEVHVLKESSNDLLKIFLNEKKDKKPENYKKKYGLMVAGGIVGGAASTAGKDLYTTGKLYAQKGLSNLGSYLKTPNGKKIGAALTAALVIYAAIVVYEKNFAEVSKQCGKFKGPEKINCIKKFKINAIQKQIQTLRQGMITCSSKENKQKCENVIKVKILKLENKLSEMR